MPDQLAELEYKISELTKSFHRLMDLAHMEHIQFTEFDRGLREVTVLIKQLKKEGTDL